MIILSKPEISGFSCFQKIQSSDLIQVLYENACLNIYTQKVLLINRTFWSKMAFTKHNLK